jgi:hypothetical protein
MPAMANIVITDAASASQTFTAAVPSAGDKSPAVWRNISAHANVGFRPKFMCMTRDNANRNGRVIDVSLQFPIVETVNSVDVVAATVPLRLTGTLPTNVSASEVADAFHQFGALVASTLIRSVASEGYAPT